MSIHKKIFLAFDTSCEIGMVVLFDENKIYYSHSLEEKFSHGQRLFDALDQVLDLLKSNNINLDAVFVGLGPGSFVGLRISLAAALGFCWGRDLALLGFCSHQALAYSFEAPNNNINILTKASGDLCYLTCFGQKPQASCVISKTDMFSKINLDSFLVTNLELGNNSPIIIKKAHGPSSQGIQKACLLRLAVLGEIKDEKDYIKPNYVKAPSVSIAHQAG